MGDDKVVTKTNLLISVITVVAFLLKFFEMLYLDKYHNYRGYYVWGDIALVILIIMIYTIGWAYLSRFVGLKKGISNGYAWGYCLGILGFIVVCALKGEDIDKTKLNTSNKYDEIEKLQQLKSSGALTNEEFNIEKQKLLK